MLKPIAIATAFLAATFGFSAMTTNSQAQQDVVDHDAPESRPLPDYIIDQDPAYFSAAKNVAFLGESGIGEYWRFELGADTCVGFWDGIDEGYLSVSCEETRKVNNKGIASTYMSIDGDEVYTQDAWFTGDVGSTKHGNDAVVKLRHDIVPDAGKDSEFKAEKCLEELQDEKVIVEPVAGDNEVIEMIHGAEQKLSVE